MGRGKKGGHANWRVPVPTLDIDIGDIEISSTLTAHSSTKAFLKQDIFTKLQINNQINVHHLFQYFLKHK